MLYKIEDDSNNPARSLERITPVTLETLGYKEEDLQRWLISHIDQVIRKDELLPITQSRPGQAMPDILAIDKDGRLFIFELKRTSSDAQNLLQVMRYAQNSRNWAYDTLHSFYHDEFGNDTTLANDHAETFGLSSPLPDYSWNHDQRLVVITNGLDADTREAIRYWHSKGLQIEAWVFRVYAIDNTPYLDLEAFGSTDDPYEDAPIRYHLVNTNHGNDPASHDYIMENGRAAAFYNTKHKIDNIQKGDRVFLYKSGTGIVGLGECKSSMPSTKTPPHGPGGASEERYLDLDRFRKLRTPISASMLKQIAGYQVTLIGTYTSIRPRAGKALWDYCFTAKTT